jgi:membrane-anchored protein YejM (alkaline phosphatase superfamily)
MMSMFAGQSAEFLNRYSAERQGETRFSAWLPHTLARYGYERWAFAPPFDDMGLTPAEARFSSMYNLPLDSVTLLNRGTHADQIAHWVALFLHEHQSSAPLFAWVHLTDTHAYHEAPGPFAGGNPTIDGYDNELTYVDFHLRFMLERVHEKFDDPIVVITADHGEEFGEHGVYGHGYSLDEIEIRVPLAICATGLAPARRNDVVSTGAIPETLLELLGLPSQPRSQYQSILTARPNTSVLVHNHFYRLEVRNEVALVESQYKLVANRRQETFRLFDLESDIEERHDLSRALPEVLARMQQALFERLERLE